METKQRAIDLMKKVTLKLTRQQLEVLEMILKLYLTIYPTDNLHARAVALRAFKIYESKVRRKLFTTNRAFTITLDLSEASAIDEITSVMIRAGKFAIYETTVITEIHGSINQQTI